MSSSQYSMFPSANTAGILSPGKLFVTLITTCALAGCGVEVNEDAGVDVSTDTTQDTTDDMDGGDAQDTTEKDTRDTGNDTGQMDADVARDTGDAETDTQMDVADAHDGGDQPELTEQVELAHTPKGVELGPCLGNTGPLTGSKEKHWVWVVQAYAPSAYPFKVTSIRYLLGSQVKKHFRGDIAHRAKVWVLSDQYEPWMELPRNPQNAESDKVVLERTAQVPSGPPNSGFREVRLTSLDFGNITLKKGQKIAVAVQLSPPPSSNDGGSDAGGMDAGGMDTGVSDASSDAGSKPPAAVMTFPACILGDRATPSLWVSPKNRSAGKDGQLPVAQWINFVQQIGVPANLLQEVNGLVPPQDSE